MTLVGIHFTTSAEGERSYTLHVTEEFAPYYKAPENGRNAAGERAESIYVGSYDCKDLRPGQHIEIFYDKAITTKKGTFQPIKRIEILK